MPNTSMVHGSVLPVAHIYMYQLFFYTGISTLLSSIWQEYLSRHQVCYNATGTCGDVVPDWLSDLTWVQHSTCKQVIDRFNAALESLFDCESLPEDPLPFIMDQMRAPPRRWVKALSTHTYTKHVHSYVYIMYWYITLCTHTYKHVSALYRCILPILSATNFRLQDNDSNQWK